MANCDAPKANKKEQAAWLALFLFLQTDQYALPQ
jgi:hypothetical protein